jgi:hypothetical protein
MAKPDVPPGQEKLHPITDGVATVYVTQEEWRTNGDHLKAEGWSRVEEGTPVVTPVKPEGS